MSPCAVWLCRMKNELFHLVEFISALGHIAQGTEHGLDFTLIYVPGHVPLCSSQPVVVSGCEKNK